MTKFKIDIRDETGGVNPVLVIGVVMFILLFTAIMTEFMNFNSALTTAQSDLEKSLEHMVGANWEADYEMMRQGVGYAYSYDSNTSSWNDNLITTNTLLTTIANKKDLVYEDGYYVKYDSEGDIDYRFEASGITIDYINGDINNVSEGEGLMIRTNVWVEIMPMFNVMGEDFFIGIPMPIVSRFSPAF
jgi:hypothetical protein